MANETLDSNWNPDRPKYAYTVVQRKDGTSRWISIGRAFINRDHSINVLLDATPTNGKLQIREWTPRPEDAKALTADQRLSDSDPDDEPQAPPRSTARSSHGAHAVSSTTVLERF
jgi:hypothetical protein